MTMLTGSDEQAIEQIRALLPPAASPRRARPAGMPAQRWQQLSQTARGRFLRALDPDLSPADRIRYRTGTPQAAIPADPPGLLAARARAIPQLLWPEWAIRLMPARGFAPGPFRSTIAACLLLPGNPDRATRTAITALHAYRSALAIGAVLRALAGNGHDTRAHRDQLPGRLPRQHAAAPSTTSAAATSSPPKRSPPSSGASCATAPPPTPAKPAGTDDAQRYLFQLLTGADLHDPRHALAFTTTSDYSHYHAFADALPTGLRDALHDHAAALLHRPRHQRAADLGPAARLLRRPDLPGPEPDDIDLDAVRQPHHHRQAPRRRRRRAAGHQHRPRPARARTHPPARAAVGPIRRPLVWQRQQHARAILTREFFERQYMPAGKNLRQLEAETGIPRRFLTQVAREHGITMAGVPGPAGSRSRYRDRMPISLGPDAAAARQAASLFRILANPTRLAILLTLQTGEQRITELTAQLGGSQANISAHLTRLKQAGLITSRAQGRAVYYRLTQPELERPPGRRRAAARTHRRRPPRKMTNQ